MLLTGRELARRGHTIVFALPPDGHTAKAAREAGFTVHDLPIRQDYDVPSAMKLKDICLREKPDVMHAHHPQAHAVSLIAKYLGAPPPLAVTRRVIFPIRTNFFSAIKYRSPKIARYIGVCNAVKTELVKGGVAAEKVEVIPSAVNLEVYEGVADARKDLQWSEPFRIGMVGHYATFKGHEVMLKAARSIFWQIPNARILLIGRDTEKLAPLVKELGYTDQQIGLMGERRDVPELLKHLHVFAMPSLQEGIATALIEAQAAGVPAVGSNVGGIPDVMVHGETGLLVPPNDPARLAESICYMLKNPQAAHDMSLKAKERVSKLFGILSVASRLEDFYCGLSAKDK